MPYVSMTGRVYEYRRQCGGRAVEVSWSELATDVGVELRYDPPTEDGDCLHDAQRDELRRVLATHNARL